MGVDFYAGCEHEDGRCWYEPPDDVTPEQARSWLIEQGELTLDDAAAATKRGQETSALMDKLAERDDWVGEIYKGRKR